MYDVDFALKAFPGQLKFTCDVGRFLCGRLAAKAIKRGEVKGLYQAYFFAALKIVLVPGILLSRSRLASLGPRFRSDSVSPKHVSTRTKDTKIC